jgi:drug/metabolite transporter superfamily protein YnfA
MKELSPLRRTIGLVLVMIGGFWAAISLGFLEESFMTGQPIYTVLGAIVALAGVLVLVIKPKAPPAAEAPDESE